MEHNVERLNDSFGAQGDQQEPPPSTLFTRPVLLTIANYGALSFLETGNWIVLPLVYTASVQVGGLGLDPTLMGVCMAVWGILRGLFQLTAFGRILNFLGLRRTFIMFLSGLVPSFLLFSINGTHAKNSGTDTILLVLVLIQLICSIGASMAYSTYRSLSRLMHSRCSLTVPRRRFQAVSSYTSHLQLRGVCWARQTASPRRSSLYSVRSRRRSLHRCFRSHWRRTLWAATACSTHSPCAVSGPSGSHRDYHRVGGNMRKDLEYSYFELR